MVKVCNNSLVSLLIIAVLAGCNTNKTNEFYLIEFEKVEEIQLPLDNPGKNIPYSYQYAVIDSKESMILYMNDMKLLFYDLDTRGKYHQIELDFRQLSGFHYINKDSILLWYANQFSENGYLDSNLIMVNYNGKFVKNYSFAGKTPVWCSGNMPLSKDSAVYPYLYFQKLDFYKNTSVFPLYRWKSHTFTADSFYSVRSNIISFYDYKTEQLISSDSFWYPYIEKGVYYSEALNTIFYCRSSDNNPLIRFAYSSDIFEWDQNSFHKHTIKSVLLDSIKPQEKLPGYRENLMDAMYTNIMYDPYRQFYYSLISFNYDKYGGLWQIIVADKDFNYIGETALNIGMKTSTPVFTKDHIITAEVGEGNYLNICYYKLKKIKADKAEFITSMHDSLDSRLREQNEKVCKITGDTAGRDARDILKYFRNKLSINENKYAVISVYANDGCHGCRDYVLELIGVNRSVFEGLPFYLVVSGRNSSELKTLLKKNNLHNFSHLKIDSLKEYNLFDPYGLKNPRLTLVRDNKIISDTVYFPDGVNKKLFPLLLDFLDLKFEDERD